MKLFDIQKNLFTAATTEDRHIKNSQILIDLK